MTVEQYRAAVEQVTVADVAAVAETVRLHTSYFLKGVEA
jgi:predicted Zn-dependent peptidase